MIEMIIWSIIGLINLFNKSVPKSIRLIIFMACLTIVIKQLALMGVIRYG